MPYSSYIVYKIRSVLYCTFTKRVLLYSRPPTSTKYIFAEQMFIICFVFLCRLIDFARFCGIIILIIDIERENILKQKLLIIGITMNAAGTEKSFLSFAQSLDYEKYDVDLLLAVDAGPFRKLIPKEINVTELEKHGDMFTLSAKNAPKIIFNSFIKKNPLFAFYVLPYFVRLVFSKGKKRADIATRMWCDLLRFFPKIDKEYDVAVAYWGDRPMFSLVDRVKAKKKIAWLHFDYDNPPRDDKTYTRYFEKCDKIVAVSDVINKSLCRHFPQYEDKFITIENINNPKLIREMAQNGKSFGGDPFSGKRILTVGRISEQKGIDIAISALAKIVKAGYDVRWYVLGTGDKEYVDEMKGLAKREGVADRFIFLGTTDNVYSYMKDCDIYAQPSRHEGKPIAVEEAKILCRPIVCADYLSAKEQLKNGEYGVVCDIDPDSVASAVISLLTDEGKRSDLTKNLEKADFGNVSEIEKFYSL